MRIEFSISVGRFNLAGGLEAAQTQPESDEEPARAVASQTGFAPNEQAPTLADRSTT